MRPFADTPGAEPARNVYVNLLPECHTGTLIRGRGWNDKHAESHFQFKSYSVRYVGA